MLESQKLVIAKLVRESSEHGVAIRSPRADVLEAVKRDYGTLFAYWKTAEDVLPAEAGVAYIIADDELLPSEESGEKVRVPTNTKLQAVASSSAVGDVSDGAVTEGEKRGEERTSLPTAFN